MSTQQRGVVHSWKDDKGFGFITPDSGGVDIFFHITEVVGRSKRPSENMVVYFNVKRDEQQRLQAVNIHLDSESVFPVLVSLLIVSLFYALIGMMTIIRILPPWVFFVYVVISGITYFIYGNDKTRAVTGQRRVPEKRLHLFELLGGWPGGLVAQAYFRHKNRKVSYQITYWIMVLLNIFLLVVVALFTYTHRSLILSAGL